MKKFLIAATFAVLAVRVASAAAPIDASDPSKLIESAATAMLNDLEANRAEYRKDPKKVEKLVGENLLPYFDSEYSARLVLAKHWTKATADQRKRFVDAFYSSLLKNYGAALVEFTADRMKVFPAQIAPKGNSATVKTEIRRDNGDRIPVIYSLRKGDQGWKAWDVTIEGISYVKSFREDFGTEIDQKGLDAVIQRLESGASPVKKAA